MTQNLKTLDPEQLLAFLINIDSIQAINIKLIKVGEIETWVNDNAPVVINLNGYEYTGCWVYSGLMEVIGSFYFMSESQRAYKMAVETIVDTLQDWYENEYQEYVRNDTGYGIKESFTNEVITEIDRINNLFE